MTELAVRERPSEPASRELSLVERAIEAQADFETIKQIVELQRQQEERAAKRAFDAAMSRALANLPNIVKNTPADRYKYETLTAVISAVREPLSREGLSFRWKMDQTERIVRVTCVISHEAGHAEETTLASPAEGPRGTNAVQAIGATVSYLQRYTLKAALGVAAGEDTDGVAPRVINDEPPLGFDVGPILNKIKIAKCADDIRALKPEIARIPPGPERVAAVRASADKIKELEAGHG